MKSHRAEFTKATKANAFLRCCGKCEGCFARLLGRPEYHHMTPAALGGSNDLDNCKVLCSKCHRIETSTVTVPTVAKAVRVAEKRMGLRPSSRPFPQRIDPWGKNKGDRA